MQVKTLIMQPFKIGAVIGLAVRFQDVNSQIADLFLTPPLANFLIQQFVEIDKRFEVEVDTRKFGARIQEFVAARDRLGLPEIGPASIVRDLAVDEQQLPIVLSAINTKDHKHLFRFDEVAVHGLVAELADNYSALLTAQGQG